MSFPKSNSVYELTEVQKWDVLTHLITYYKNYIKAKGGILNTTSSVKNNLASIYTLVNELMLSFPEEAETYLNKVEEKDLMESYYPLGKEFYPSIFKNITREENFRLMLDFYVSIFEEDENGEIRFKKT